MRIKSTRNAKIHFIFQTVARHFKTIPVVEKEALTFFIYMAKSHKSRLDNKHLEGLSS